MSGLHPCFLVGMVRITIAGYICLCPVTWCTVLVGPRHGEILVRGVYITTLLPASLAADDSFSATNNCHIL